MKKKKLGKLELKKERIANLNDSEMNNIQGGTSGVVLSIVTGAISGSVAAGVYDYGQDESYWNCDDEPNGDEGISEYVVADGCLIPGVDCYGIAP